MAGHSYWWALALVALAAMACGQAQAQQLSSVQGDAEGTVRVRAGASGKIALCGSVYVSGSECDDTDAMDSIAALLSTVSALQTDVTNLAARVTAAEDRVSDLETENQGLKDKIDALTTGKADKSGLDAAVSDVAGNTLAIGSLEDRLEDESSERFDKQSNLDTRVTALESASLDKAEVTAIVNEMLMPSADNTLNDMFDYTISMFEAVEKALDLDIKCGECDPGYKVKDMCVTGQRTTCEQCPPNTYSPGGFATECIAHISCQSDEYIESPPTTSSQTVCKTCTPVCSGDTYQSQDCANGKNRICSACTTCSLGVTYETTPCSSLQNRVCSNCGSCSSGSNPAKACTLTSNTVCCPDHNNLVTAVHSLAAYAGASTVVSELTQNEHYATNRDCYALEEIPSKYLGVGAVHLSGDNDKYGTVSFDVSSPVTVVAAADGRQSNAGLPSNFVNTGEKINFKGCHAPTPFYIYEADYPAGRVQFSMSQVRMMAFWVVCRG